MSFNVEYITEISVPPNVFEVLFAGLDSQDEYNVLLQSDYIQFRYESDELIRINKEI